MNVYWKTIKRVLTILALLKLEFEYDSLTSSSSKERMRSHKRKPQVYYDGGQ